MLCKNLKNFRKSKGLSQEELAVRLNVVRQTVSKWEQGLSVPDCQILLKIADELGTTVGTLLGETLLPEDAPDLTAIAAKLEILNTQFAKRNEARRKIWRGIFIAVGILAFLSLVQGVIAFAHLKTAANDISASTAIIGGADGPTGILVFRSPNYGLVIAAILALVAAIAGIVKTKRK